MKTRSSKLARLALVLGLTAWALAVHAQTIRTATAQATVVDGYVVGVTLTDGGGGYGVPPAVCFVGGGGSGAVAETRVRNGVVDRIVLVAAGSGYAPQTEVNIKAPEMPMLESVQPMIVLTIRGQIGATHPILATDKLVPATWRLLTNVVVTSSPYVWVDEAASALKRQYQISATPEVPVGKMDPRNWAWIQPGIFTMGSPETERGRDYWEGPQTRVILTRGFWMGKCEVTQEEYLAVVGGNPSSFRGDLERPVENLRWHDARAYCVALTAREQTAGQVPTGYAYRLPTDAEWE